MPGYVHACDSEHRQSFNDIRDLARDTLYFNLERGNCTLNIFLDISTYFKQERQYPSVV